MIVRIIPFILLLQAAAAGADPAVRAARPQVAPSVHVAVATADSLQLVWRFALQDGWYLYAPYRNDTGFAPQIALDLPAGWTAGPPTFPAPERKVLPGGILDHVYAHDLLVTQTLRSGGRPAPAGGLTAELTWLACRDLCVPGQATLEIPTDGRPSGQAAALLERALDGQPAALPAGSFHVERSPQAIRLTVPGAARLAFIPVESGPLLADLLHDGAAEGQVLVLRLRPDQQPDEPLHGLLSIDYEDGRRLTGAVILG